MKPLEIRYDNGVANSQDIAQFELQFKSKLPKDFKSFSLAHNAARLVKSSFEFLNKHATDYVWHYKIENGIDSRDISFYGFGAELPDYLQIEQAQDFDVYGHDHVIAFGSSANGDYICFDYRHDPTTDTPRVVVMFHDAYDSNRKMLICDVANSFEEFMDSLYKFEG